jgi:hypothetical protein
MNLRLLKLFLLLLFSCIFTGLIFRQGIGINLIVYELIIVVSIILIHGGKFSIISWISGSGWLLSSFAAVMINTSFSIWMNLIGFVFFCSAWLWKEIHHPFILLWLFILNIYRSQHKQWEILFKLPKSGQKGSKWFRRILTVFIIAAIVALFIIFYKTSSEYFNQNYKLINNVIVQFLNLIFGEITVGKVLFFILGFTFTSALMLKNEVFKSLFKADRKPGSLVRYRKPTGKPGLRKGLKNERIAGIILLICLNLLILFQNFLDIKNIWVNFSWNGSYLKQFVHEGTSILILSIVISAALVLYIFRKNQNFYKRNIWLKRLTYLWLFQNGVLAVSVGMRNYWYINYYNLAYLRIGVFIFLVLVVSGLFLVVFKIHKKKTGFFIFGRAILASYVILTFFSLFNWDNIIVRYNISHAGEAYFHHDFLVTMPDKTLWLMKEKEDLFNVQVKTDSFHVYTRSYFGAIDTTETYLDLLKYRYEHFKNDWEKRSWKSWNYSDAIAYKKLFSK